MKIPFEKEYQTKYFNLLKQVFDSSFLSEGEMVKTFEKQFGEYSGTDAVAVNSGGAGLLSLLEYIDVKGADVIVPANTFMATPLSVKRAGGNIVFADCNRYDLSLSRDDLKKRVTKKTKAVIVVHIGGHIAFDIFEIADFCKRSGIFLIEDCAHAHGAEFKGKQAGTFGLGGAYSFYATKTMPLGEGGMVVSNNNSLLTWIRDWRNYGKFEYRVEGWNARMNEVTAALGIVQLERLPHILKWKRDLAEKFDQIFTKKILFPQGMTSGYYKYIVFEKVKHTTGLVFGDMCHDLMNVGDSLPHSDWVKQNHWCPPIYYGWEHADKSVDELREILLYG